MIKWLLVTLTVVGLWAQPVPPMIGSTILGPNTIGSGPSQLPTASLHPKEFRYVTDALTPGSATGGGTTQSILWSNGTSWVATSGSGGGGGACPGGSVDGEVQFKDGANCGGNGAFTFDKSTGLVVIGASPPMPTSGNERLNVGVGGDVPDSAIYAGTPFADLPATVQSFITYPSTLWMFAYSGTSSSYGNGGLTSVYNSTDDGVEAISAYSFVDTGGNTNSHVFGFTGSAGTSGNVSVREASAFHGALTTLDTGGITTGEIYFADDGIIFASGTIVNQQGYNCRDLTVGTATNECFHSDVTPGAGKLSFNDAGGAGILSASLAGSGIRPVSTDANGKLGILTKLGLAYGGTNSDLSATGGASQVLKQSTVGGNVTVGQLAYSDLTGSPTLTINGMPFGGGTAPSLGSCVSGSALATGARNNAFTVNLGAGITTSCVVNFGQNFTNAPTCTVSDDSTTIAADISAVSASSVTLGISAALANGHLYVLCQ